MNEQSKREKKTKTKSKTQIRDLKPKKDAKGGDGPTESISLTYGTIHKQY
jgi:hypothetical protein